MNVFMPRLNVILTAEEIAALVRMLAEQVNRDYENKNPLLLGVLKGCFVFMADLVRCLNMPLEVEFVTLSSYGLGRRESCGTVVVIQGLRASVEGRHVLIVEDIVDTGQTLKCALDYLRELKPASLKVCALFDKPARHVIEVPIDYLGCAIPDTFVVGYGLDYDERFRHLPALYALDEDQ